MFSRFDLTVYDNRIIDVTGDTFRVVGYFIRSLKFKMALNSIGNSP
jgi:hypothetical protein